MFGTQQRIQKFLVIAFATLIILVAVLSCSFSLLSPISQDAGTRTISQVLVDAQAGRMAAIEIGFDDAHDIFVTYRDQPNMRFYSRIPADTTIIDLLTSADVPLDSLDVHVARRPAWDGSESLIPALLPVAMMFCFFIFFYRRARSQQLHRTQQEPPQE